MIKRQKQRGFEMDNTFSPITSTSTPSLGCVLCRTHIEELQSSVSKLQLLNSEKDILVTKKQDQLSFMSKVLNETEKKLIMLQESIKKLRAQNEQLLTKYEQITQQCLEIKEFKNNSEEIINYYKVREFQLLKKIKKLQIQLLKKSKAKQAQNTFAVQFQSNKTQGLNTISETFTGIESFGQNSKGKIGQIYIQDFTLQDCPTERAQKTVKNNIKATALLFQRNQILTTSLTQKISEQ